MTSAVARPSADLELGRSARKRAAILEAAHDLFLQKGYAGTSMDDVAARAAVSKQTVYKNFADKQRLFTEVITSDVGRIEASTQAQMAAMPDSSDLAGDLAAFARWHLADVMQPGRLRLRRMLIGEAERFPELAQAWYASGPERSYAEFAGWFAAWDRRGLRPDPGPDAGGPAVQLAGAVDPAQQGHGVRDRRAAVHPSRAGPLRRRGGPGVPGRLRGAGRDGLTRHGSSGVPVCARRGPSMRGSYCGSRWIGQLMHRGPPRPRPSSPPGISSTSMPFARRSVFVDSLRS